MEKDVFRSQMQVVRLSEAQSYKMAGPGLSQARQRYMLALYLAFNLLRLKSEGEETSRYRTSIMRKNNTKQQRLPTRKGRARVASLPASFLAIKAHLPAGFPAGSGGRAVLRRPARPIRRMFLQLVLEGLLAGHYL